ncbi:MAG TPA: AI-2E family transporter [Aeromicrobium sp.]|nr:AI-2E family transporter [Aeromicrobium sp.]
MSTSSGSGADDKSRRISPVWVFLVGAAALTIVLSGLHEISSIVGPVFLALVITVTVHPFRRRLEQTRMPEWAVSTIMLIAAYLLILILTLALIVSVAQLAVLLPQYAAGLTDVIHNVAKQLQNFGVKESQVTQIVKALDPGQILGFVGSFLGGTLSALTNIFFLFTVLLFMTYDTNSMRRGIKDLAGGFGGAVNALSNFAAGARTYMLVAAIFGLIVAAIDGVALYVIGVPGAFVWAVLAFVTNFIPNIGFVIGLIPPALIGLLEGGPKMMVVVIVMYCLVNLVIQSIIQPRVVGESVGLTPTLTFLSLVFWAWLLGPLGALLAVPLSLLLKAVLVEVDPKFSWTLPLISGQSASSSES